MRTELRRLISVWLLRVTLVTLPEEKFKLEFAKFLRESIMTLGYENN